MHRGNRLFFRKFSYIYLMWTEVEAMKKNNFFESFLYETVSKESGCRVFGTFFQKKRLGESFESTISTDGSAPYHTFTFTGKERDEETGYGYFGARYMDHELMTMWLSVDPMSDKYPSMSPYSYCAWNPMKLVDPDGREIDDYFSKSGKYLGSDNATTNNVRIMSEDIWNGLQKDPMGRIDKNVGYVLSTDFATASQKEMSPESQLNVYKHYNPTNYELKNLDNGGKTFGMRTTQSNMEDPVIKIRVKGNSLGIKVCNNAEEIKNLFAHEKGHIQQCQTIGFSVYKQLTKSEQEAYAVRAQMSDPSWEKTRQSFKKSFIEYGKKYGLYILSK